jgi:ribonuclease III
LTLSNLDALLARLGLGAGGRTAVLTALTHGSAVQKGGESYERLEFVGDRVLGLGVALMLQERFPSENEGQLALRHAALVKEGTLAAIGRAWELGPLLVLGPSEKNNGGVEKDSILADAVEALLAVVWNEAGPDKALGLVQAAWAPYVETVASSRDAKTALQELLQAKKAKLPLYEVVASEGPEHDRTYTVRVVCGAGEAQGKGRTKKEAETAAAAALMREKELTA